MHIGPLKMINVFTCRTSRCWGRRPGMGLVAMGGARAAVLAGWPG